MKRTKEAALGERTGRTPSKSRQCSNSRCFTGGGTARANEMDDITDSLTFQNIGPVGGLEVLVSGRETMDEMAKKPSRTKVSLKARHSHVHYIKDNTDHAVLFNPERYQKNRVYKPVQPAWRFSRDMPSVAASSRHVSSDKDSDFSGFAS